MKFIKIFPRKLTSSCDIESADEQTDEAITIRHPLYGGATNDKIVLNSERRMNDFYVRSQI